MTTVRLLQAEVAKLRRSLVLLLIAAVPAMVLIMLTTMRASGHGAPDWERHALSGAAIWGYLLLPLTATALTALLAQVEHGPRAWSAVLSLPCAKWRVFAVKAAVAVGAMAVISLLLWAAILASGLLAGALPGGTAPPGPLPAGLLAGVLLQMWIAGLLVVAIQFALAMAIPNFAAPVIAGIAGTFFAVAATSAKAGIYFPWLLPVNVLASEPERAAQAVLSGGMGGIAVLAAASFWLARRDWH